MKFARTLLNNLYLNDQSKKEIEAYTIICTNFHLYFWWISCTKIGKIITKNNDLSPSHASHSHL